MVPARTMAKDSMKPRAWLTIRTPLLDVIDEANPPTYMSCDWLGDPLAFGLIYFPVWVYEKIRSSQHGNSVS